MQSVKNSREDERREKRERQSFLAAPGLIAPSRNVMEAIVAAAPAVGRPEIVLPNAFARDRPAVLSAEAAPDGILFVGRFDVHKGGDTVIDAFSSLLETHPQARLTFVGVDQGVRQPSGPPLHLRTVLPSMRTEVRNQIDYPGRLEWAEVERLRAKHAVAVIASRYETFGYTVLEAMAAGQAIVSTNVGGPAEILQHEKTALLVPPDDPSAMAAALARLHDEPDLRRRLGGNARAALETGFAPAVIAGQLVDFVTEALHP